MLIQEQSFDRLLDVIRSKKFTVVVCLSPQSVASIAQFTDMNINKIFLKIAHILKQLGVFYVVDSSSAGDVALVESKEEFMLR